VVLFLTKEDNHQIMARIAKPRQQEWQLEQSSFDHFTDRTYGA